MIDPRPTSIDLAGLALRNPVILAAGTAGYLDETADVLDLSAIGAIVTKSITADPREGNKTWRILESRHGGMLNAIGLANVGVEAFARDIAPRAGSIPCAVIGSISEFSVEGFVKVAAAMDDAEGIPAVELNVSCPNVAHGCEFGSDPALLAELVSALRPVLSKTRMFVKLSPTVVGAAGGVAAIARAAIDPAAVLRRPCASAGPNSRPGADAVCLANTMPALAIDVTTRHPRLSRGSGGLSGPAVHPLAVKLVHDAYTAVCKSTATPIVGIGGVMNWEDAAEFILAGATAVEMGTALFVDPRAPSRVARGLDRWVREQGVGSIRDLVGAMVPNE